MSNSIMRPTRTEGAPQLWIGCLACYNEGYLAGFWVDAIDAPTSVSGDNPLCCVNCADELEDDLSNGVGSRFCDDEQTQEHEIEPHWNALVNEADTPVSPHHYRDGHEELWVMDHDGFHGLLTEECSPATGRKIGEAIVAMQADGVDPEAFAAYWVNRNGTSVEELEWDAPTRSEFEGAYRGVHESMQDYVQELHEETDRETLEALPSNLRSWINWEGVARDHEMNSDSWTAAASAGGVHVFDV